MPVPVHEHEPVGEHEPLLGSETADELVHGDEVQRVVPGGSPRPSAAFASLRQPEAVPGMSSRCTVPAQGTSKLTVFASAVLRPEHDVQAVFGETEHTGIVAFLTDGMDLASNPRVKVRLRARPHLALASATLGS